MTMTEFIYYAAAILEEDDMGHTITLRELRDEAANMPLDSDGRAAVNRLMSAIENAENS